MHKNDLNIQDDTIGTAILLSGGIFAFLACAVIYFVILYRNRQLKNKKEQEQLQAAFRQELLKTQIEIQEQTLENVSKEIHDNITQVLSFVKLSLGILGNDLDDVKKTKISESRELVAQTINDLRDMSKSMSFEHITAQGLARTVEKEAERCNKVGLFNVNFSVDGREYPLGEQRELVLFRILQEGLNNAVKHSNAKNFNICLQYSPDLFTLILQDDGSGFAYDQLINKNGSGLRNMENRAAMIGGKAKIDSSPGQGCKVSITINPYNIIAHT